jgi:hypothetical protein
MVPTKIKTPITRTLFFAEKRKERQGNCRVAHTPLLRVGLLTFPLASRLHVMR